MLIAIPFKLELNAGFDGLATVLPTALVSWRSFQTSDLPFWPVFVAVSAAASYVMNYFTVRVVEFVLEFREARESH